MSKGKNVELAFEGPRHPTGAPSSECLQLRRLWWLRFHRCRTPDQTSGDELAGYRASLARAAGMQRLHARLGGANTYGWLKPANAGETFDLKSGIFASGYREPLVVRFWTFNANGSFHGELTLGLTQTADKVDFSEIRQLNSGTSRNSTSRPIRPMARTASFRSPWTISVVGAAAFGDKCKQCFPPGITDCIRISVMCRQMRIVPTGNPARNHRPASGSIVTVIPCRILAQAARRSGGQAGKQQFSTTHVDCFGV